MGDAILYRECLKFFTDILGPIVGVQDFWDAKTSKVCLCFLKLCCNCNWYPT